MGRHRWRLQRSTIHGLNRSTTTRGSTALRQLISTLKAIHRKLLGGLTLDDKAVMAMRDEEGIGRRLHTRGLGCDDDGCEEAKASLLRSSLS